MYTSNTHIHDYLLPCLSKVGTEAKCIPLNTHIHDYLLPCLSKVGTEAKCIPLTHIYMTTYFPVLAK